VGLRWSITSRLMLYFKDSRLQGVSMTRFRYLYFVRNQLVA
jgi:hypothetical protein